MHGKRKGTRNLGVEGQMFRGFSYQHTCTQTNNNVKRQDGQDAAIQKTQINGVFTCDNSRFLSSLFDDPNLVWSHALRRTTQIRIMADMLSGAQSTSRVTTSITTEQHRRHRSIELRKLHKITERRTERTTLEPESCQLVDEPRSPSLYSDTDADSDDVEDVGIDAVSVEIHISLCKMNIPERRTFQETSSTQRLNPIHAGGPQRGRWSGMISAQPREPGRDRDRCSMIWNKGCIMEGKGDRSFVSRRYLLECRFEANIEQIVLIWHIDGFWKTRSTTFMVSSSLSPDIDILIERTHSVYFDEWREILHRKNSEKILSAYISLISRRRILLGPVFDQIPWHSSSTAILRVFHRYSTFIRSTMSQ